MNVAMEETVFTSCCQFQNGSTYSIPDVLPPENHVDSLTHHTPRSGTVIPNRIFVGGIDCKVNESDLRHVFSQHGAVKEVKIVIDRSGMSKGYGFVTFETQDDALKILHDTNGICFKDKKLSIGQAIRKQQLLGQNKSALVTIPDFAMPLPMSYGTLYLISLHLPEWSGLLLLRQRSRPPLAFCSSSDASSVSSACLPATSLSPPPVWSKPVSVECRPVAAALQSSRVRPAVRISVPARRWRPCAGSCACHGEPHTRVCGAHGAAGLPVVSTEN